MTELSTSAHVDTFTLDNLPPREEWPVMEFTLPELQYPPQLNAADVLIDEAVAKYGADKVCLLSPEGETWTYGELLRRSNQVAQVLTEDLGVVPGNRVFLRAPNNPWLVASWLGVLKAGAVAVTTMPVLRGREVTTLLGLTKPSVALCDHRFRADLDKVAPDNLRIVSYGAEGSDDLIARCAAKSGEFVNVRTSCEDVALLCPTSGTTGTPKITMHFHRDILATADTFGRHIIKPTANDVFAGSPPLAFTFGLGGLVVFPLRFGAATLLTERTTPLELAQLSHDAGATILFTAPTAYRAILRAGRADLLGTLRRAASAGEHLPKDVWQDLYDATGLKLIDGIGSTELLHVFVSAADDDIRPGSTGRAVPGYRATILDDDGNEVLAGQSGRLAIIGPTGCRYMNDDRQQAYVCKGWNVTGDTFTRDEHGYFWYEARSDNMIVTSGYNVGAPEVEEAVARHLDVIENAVIGVADAERGSLICAFVVLRGGVVGDDAKRKELQDFVKATIAPYKYPRIIHFVDSLPRNPSGKLQHFRLAELVSASSDQPGRNN